MVNTRHLFSKLLPHFKVLVTQSCPILCNPMIYSSPGSSVHGILQARILEWVAISFSRRSFWTRDQTLVSGTTSRFFTIWATREASRSYFVTNKASSPHPIIERECNISEWESPNSPWGWQSWEAYHHSMSMKVLLINSCSLETSRTDNGQLTCTRRCWVVRPQYRAIKMFGRS